MQWYEQLLKKKRRQLRACRKKQGPRISHAFRSILIVLDRHHGDIIRMTQRWEHNPILINQK